MDDFHNIHESRRSDTTTTHVVSHFVTMLLKALPGMASIPFNNPDQEQSIHNERGIDSNIIIGNHIFFLVYGLVMQDEKEHILI